MPIHVAAMVPSSSYEISVDVAVIGAGAAGMMCAFQAGRRGRRVWLADHRNTPGEKIRISGGGRCNFTNIHTDASRFISENPHFCKSALNQYTADDFIALVEKHGISYHEKKLGQLFCDHSAKDIITMLTRECQDAGVDVALGTTISDISAADGAYRLETSRGSVHANSVVIACGGLSIPKIGATGFGYEIARRFGHRIITPRPGLVPLTISEDVLDLCRGLAGVSVEASVRHGNISFDEGLLFTHRGLSGPSILQISSYWQEGGDIAVNLAPTVDASSALLDDKASHPRQDSQTALARILPKRLANRMMDQLPGKRALAEMADKDLRQLGEAVNRWNVTPSGTEGYRTAEVTLGGVATDDISSRTMESRLHPGLFFIGEVVDVTGHLGGYNFQWAWSSGFAAGQHA